MAAIALFLVARFKGMMKKNQVEKKCSRQVAPILIICGKLKI